MHWSTRAIAVNLRLIPPPELEVVVVRDVAYALRRRIGFERSVTRFARFDDSHVRSLERLLVLRLNGSERSQCRVGQLLGPRLPSRSYRAAQIRRARSA